MTDLASLGLQIDSRQVTQGVGELDKLTAAGTRAEGSVNRLGSQAAAAGAQVKSASAHAAAFAANAQAMARNAVLTGNGMATMGRATGLAAYQAQNLAFQINDVVTGLASGQAPFRVFAQQGGQFFQIMQQSGLGARGFATELLRMIGVLQVTRDAELAEEAANATAAATAVKGAADRARASIAAADTEVALAAAALRVATTSEEEAAAQALLAKAHQKVAAAAAEATIAEDALAVASGRAAAASAASASKTVTSLSRMGAVGAAALTGVAIAGGLAVAVVKDFQANVSDSGVLDRYANSLGLTKKEMKELRQEVGGLSSKEMKDLDARARAFEVTWGDVWNGIKKTASDALGLDEAWAKFKSSARSAFEAVLKDAVWAAASIRAVFVAAWRTAGRDSGKTFIQNFHDAQAEGQKQILANIKTIEGNIIDASRKRIRDAANTIIEDRTPKKPKKQGDHGLAEALAELDAQIKGQRALAEAYQVSDAAAVKAEAMQKAEEQAIRHKGDVGLFYEKELALAVATRAAEGGKLIGQLSAQTAAQKAVNDSVADGTINAAQASKALQDEAQLRPLLTAQAVAGEKAATAEGKAKAYWLGIVKQLAPEIARLRDEQAKSNDEANRAQILADTSSGKNQLDRIRLETSLIGASNVERAKAIALLEAQQYLDAHPTAAAKGSPDYVEAQRHTQDYIKTQLDLAEQTANLQAANDNYNHSLSYTADLMSLINERAQITAGALGDAFGRAGEGLGTALTALSNYGAAQARIDQEHQARLNAIGKNEKARAREQTLYATQSKNLQLAAIGQTISGLKTMFKEHSVGYKAMEAAEKAFAVIQAINTIKNVAAGAAKMFATLGPFAFPAVAAMIAVMAALGFSGGNSTQKAPTSAQDLQDTAGTGTVLGSPKDKSASIAHSLEIVAANTNTDLQYSNEMLKALRSIDLSIGAMAATVAKQISVSGSLFDTSSLKLGSTGSSGFLGLFSSSTTRSLFDAGITLAATTVGNVIASGISGSSYQIVEQIKKKSGFLGIGGGTKTSYITTTGALDPQITAAVQSVIASLENGLVTAAKVIGLDGAKAMLDGFQINIGKISFKDLDAKGIEDQLNAIFSSIGDQMAGQLLPSLKDMQKVGEGLFETFTRVAKEYEAVDVELKSIGKDFGAVGVGSITARDALVQLFGGLDDFISATDSFRDKFLTQAEQIAPVQSSVIEEMQRLGVANVTTREQFKNLVLGLDLTTDAGRQMYASLLAVAPAFDKVLSYFEQVNKTTIDGLQQTIDKFNSFAASLKKYRDTLFANDATQGNAYQTLKAKFIAAANLAATGDATALGGLEQSGKDFLTAAKNNASSLQQYLRDVAMVARGVDSGIAASEDAADYAQLQLDALKNATTILQQISSNTAATASALTTAPVAQPAGTAPSTSSAAPTATTDQLAQQNETIIQQNATIIQNLTDMNRLWKRFDGDGLLVRGETDTPLYTTAAP